MHRREEPEQVRPAEVRLCDDSAEDPKLTAMLLLLLPPCLVPCLVFSDPELLKEEAVLDVSRPN